MFGRLDPDRSRWTDASTDPVVVGLGRLLVGVGAFFLLGVLSLAWLILSQLT